MRRTVVLACSFATVLAASVAAAERQETPPQLYKTGETVNLPTIGATIVLPHAPAGWALSLGIETNSNYDILRRQDPTNPQLQVDFNRPKSSDCAAIAASFDKLIQMGLKLTRRESSNLAPGSWEAWSYELPPKYEGGEMRSTQKLCTNSPTGPVLANVEYQGASSALDASWVRPLLEEVGRAVNGKRGTSSAIGVAPAVSANGQTTLPISGFKVVIPAGFNTRVLATETGRQFDAIVRVDPEFPRFFMSVEKKPGKCSLHPNSGAFFIDSPPYLPEGWNPRGVQLPPRDGLNTSVLCADLGNDHAWAVVTYEGDLTHPDVLATRTILGPVTEGRGGVGTTTPSTGDDVPSGGYGSEPANAKGHGLFELGIVQLTPPGGDERPLGVTAGVDALSTSNKGKTIGVGVELAGLVGFGGSGFTPWDIRLGLGPSVKAGPFMLIPMLGIGADGVGGEHFKAKSAAYYYLGGRMLLYMSPSFTAQAYVSVHRRGVDEQDVNRELRYGGFLSFTKLAVGVRVTQYSLPEDTAARTLAGILAFYL